MSSVHPRLRLTSEPNRFRIYEEFNISLTHTYIWIMRKQYTYYVNSYETLLQAPTLDQIKDLKSCAEAENLAAPHATH